MAVLPIQELPSEDIEKQSRVSLSESLRISLKNEPYRIYLVNQIGMQFSFRILSAIMPFYAVSVLKLGLGDTLVMTAPWILFALISFPIWGALTRKFGKKQAFIYSMMIFTFPLLLSFLFILLPENILELTVLDIDFLQVRILISFVMVAIIGFGMGGLWIFPPTFVGDIVDDEERRLGLRRESMYYAFQEFTEKLAIAFAIFLEGLILGVFVAERVLHPDYPPELGIYYYYYNPLGPILLMGVLAFIPMLIALLIFRRFPDELIVEEN